MFGYELVLSAYPWQVLWVPDVEVRTEVRGGRKYRVLWVIWLGRELIVHRRAA